MPPAVSKAAGQKPIRIDAEEEYGGGGMARRPGREESQTIVGGRAPWALSRFTRSRRGSQRMVCVRFRASQ